MSSEIESALLGRKSRLKLGGLVSLVGASGMLSTRCIDDKLWKYSVVCWSTMFLSAGLYGLYKNTSYESKINLTKLCNKFGSYFL